MTKRIPIVIESFREAVPKEGVWYSYGGDIYYSVICAPGRTSHLRGESARESSSIDKIMSAWHRDWQYNQIEHYYGFYVKGEKTFERAIEHDGERHIIDSLVDRIAIEFQHTLSTAVYELDSRFDAQISNGYLPYLVLDFSNYSMPLVLKTISDLDSTELKKKILDLKSRNVDVEVLRKMHKWTTSKHFIQGNLFFEFKDLIIRFHPQLLKGYCLTKAIFIENLLDLENILEECIQKDILVREKFELKTRERMQQIAIREEEEREEEKRREENSKLFALRNNKLEKDGGLQYERFRHILTNPVVGKYLKNIDFDKMLFVEDTTSKSNGANYIKDSIYLCEEEGIMLHYRTNSAIENQSKKIYNFLCSEIRIHRKQNSEIISYYFKKERGSPWRKVEARSELAINYLHSSRYPALIKYDDQGQIITKEWYLFNKKVDEDIFEYANEDCMYSTLEYNKDELSADQYSRLKAFSRLLKTDEDPHRFIELTISNYGITERHFKEYYKYEWITFDNHLQKRFYVRSLYG